MPEPQESAWDAADRMLASGEHQAAAAAYARAWEQEHAPAILYSWAQAERLAGDCDAAADLYGRFTVEGAQPPASYDSELLRAQWSNMLANAERQQQACLEQVPAPSDATSPGESPDVSEAQPAPEPAAIEREPEPRATPLPVDHPPRRRADTAGWALVGAGAATATTGAVLVGLAAQQDARAGQAGTHDDFRDDLQRARTQQTIGFVALGVGAALAVGGVVRLALVKRERKRAVAQIGSAGVVIVF